MSILETLNAMNKVAQILDETTCKLEDGTSLLGEWKDLADEYEPDEISGKLETLEEWECIESLYGFTAGEVEEKLDELSEWEDVSNWHGSPEEVKDKLEDRADWVELGDEFGSVEDIRTILKEHGTTDMEELKTLLAETNDKVEELEAAVTKADDSATKAWEEGAHQWAELTALKNRTRWQTFLSIFAGRS